MTISIEHWQDDWGELSEAALRARLEAQGYTVNRYCYSPGTSFPDHTHDCDKKDAVLSGTFKICAAGQEFVLKPGDTLDVPAGLVHSAEVLGNDTVVSLDAIKIKQR